MLDERQSIVVIPARGGSKRFPRKNVASLNGKPLLSYAVAAGLHASCVDKTYVSTEDPEIASIAIESGAEVPYERPAHLAKDDVIADTVVVDLINNIIERKGANISNVVLIQPTSPFVKAEHIDAAITLLNQRPDLSSVTTLSSVDHRFHPYNLSFKQGEGKWEFALPEARKNSLTRQSKPPSFSFANLFAARVETFLSRGRFGESKGAVVVDPIYAWDIDYEWELEIAEFFINRGMVDLTHHPYPSDAASKTLQILS